MFRELRAKLQEFATVGASTHASSIAYYTFFSIVPLLALCISLIMMVGVGKQDIFHAIDAVVPDALHDLVHTIVSDAYDRSGLAFSLSTLSLLWSASKGAVALRAGLNAAYNEKETRSAIAVAVISVVAVIVVGVLIAAAMWMVFGHSVRQTLANYLPGIQNHEIVLEVMDLTVTLVIGVLLIALCYTLLPAGYRRFKSQLPGAACALVGCGALSYGFRVYVDLVGNYTVLYGSIATIAMLLFWMYLVFYIVIAGGYINRKLQGEPEAHPEEREQG